MAVIGATPIAQQESEDKARLDPPRLFW